MTLDGDSLTADGIDALLAGTDGLRFLRGQWVEVRRDTLQKMIDEFGRIERTPPPSAASRSPRRCGSPPARRSIGDAAEAAAEREWAQVVPGPWMRDVLAGLRGPEGLAPLETDGALNATLRPYQDAGVRWLRLLSSLGLGACLADDMGLGKTLQVLALLVARGARRAGEPPALVVAPASLLANWAAEAARFTPSLRVLVAHPSAMPRAELKAIDPRACRWRDRSRHHELRVAAAAAVDRRPTPGGWSCSTRRRRSRIPAARQTRAVKALAAPARIALTGTPVENRLTDLWSIFDVINPGLLGSHQAFARWTKRLAAAPQRVVRAAARARAAVHPAADEDRPGRHRGPAGQDRSGGVLHALRREQAALYQQAVEELATRARRHRGHRAPRPGARRS